mmetsp:Transcript_148236/g.412837  ORF Transcript_148236/g.412837 Transcript_148236/m.412837 type:complete len:230 (+) Transcript_148236:339-1028(+)
MRKGAFSTTVQPPECAGTTHDFFAQLVAPPDKLERVRAVRDSQPQSHHQALVPSAATVGVVEVITVRVLVCLTVAGAVEPPDRGLLVAQLVRATDLRNCRGRDAGEEIVVDQSPDGRVPGVGIHAPPISRRDVRVGDLPHLLLQLPEERAVRHHGAEDHHPVPLEVVALLLSEAAMGNSAQGRLDASLFLEAGRVALRHICGQADCSGSMNGQNTQNGPHVQYQETERQ